MIVEFAPAAPVQFQPVGMQLEPVVRAGSLVVQVVRAVQALHIVVEPVVLLVVVLRPALVAQVFAGFEYRSARKMQHRV